MIKHTTLLSALLREFEAEIGMKDLDIVVLRALIQAIKSFKVSNYTVFENHFNELEILFKSTEPKFAILIFQMSKLHSFINNFPDKYKKTNTWKKKIIKHIQELIKESQRAQKQIVKYAEKIDIDNKTILIHDHSHTVQDVLVHLKSMGKKFKVVIAEQEHEKTQDNIERLHKAKIPFMVVPDYMLSHVHDSIDMLFFGALTLKDTLVFVTEPGTHSIITEFHTAKIPVFLFINTLKFSLWKSKRRVGVFMHKHKRKHSRKNIEYERIKYSHDRVPADLFTKIVTNEGILTPSSLKRLFDSKLK